MRWILLVLFLVAGCAKGPLATPEAQSSYAPIPTLRFDYSAKEITALCEEQTSRLLKAFDEVATKPLDTVSFETSIHALEYSTVDSDNQLGPILSVLETSGSSPGVKNAARDCDKTYNQMKDAQFSRQELYARIKRVNDQDRAKLDAIEQRVLDQYLFRFRRNGLQLSQADQSWLRSAKEELDEVQRKFVDTLDNGKDQVLAAPNELTGVSRATAAQLGTTHDGAYVISKNQFYEVLEEASNPVLRKRIEYAYNREGGQENVRLLERALELRYQIARRLGYSNWAEYALDGRMAANPARLSAFLQTLKDGLRPRRDAELAALSELKRQEEPNAPTFAIQSWDLSYYERKLNVQRYHFDSAEIRKYFPLSKVLPEALKIFSELLSVDFVADPSAPKWDPTVVAYRVVRDGKTIGKIYLDLIGRVGKYAGGTTGCMITEYVRPDGRYQTPVAVSSHFFPPPTDEVPTLLSHDQVRRLFHELGHAMHCVFSQARFPIFAGTNVAWDFVEVPSNLFENWAWDPAILQRVSGYYQDPSKSLDSKTIDGIVASRQEDYGLAYYGYQLAIADFDFKVHSVDHADTTAVMGQVLQDVYVPVQPGTFRQARISHLMGGPGDYSSAYYTYLWSAVYATDLFSRFAKEGLTNPKVGADYIRSILERGGEAEPMSLMTDFLARPPSEQAFLERARPR